jgi:tRNA (adenine37-N6)-methyltransferase
VIRTPFTTFEGMPIQAVAATDTLGEIELDPAFAAGRRDIEGFAHVILLYHCVSKLTVHLLLPY